MYKSINSLNMCNKEIECSYCKKIYVTNIEKYLLKYCENHYCDECVSFWLSNIVFDLRESGSFAEEIKC